MGKRKKMREKKKARVALVCNLLLFLLEVWGTGYTFLRTGFAMLRSYGVIANLIALVSSGCLIVALLASSLSGRKLPYFVRLLKYVATVCLTVTFLAVAFLFAPGSGFRHMFLDGAFLFQHLLCPILCFVSFFLEGNHFLNGKAAVTALTPTLLYAAVMYPLNILRVIAGPYSFLLVYAQPIHQTLLFAAVFLIGNYLLALLIRWAGNRK